MNLVPEKIYQTVESSIRSMTETNERTLFTLVDDYVYFIERGQGSLRVGIAHLNTACGQELRAAARLPDANFVDLSEKSAQGAAFETLNQTAGADLGYLAEGSD